jgi:drug/metabolite transporter (DMT)-like permease
MSIKKLLVLMVLVTASIILQISQTILFKYTIDSNPSTPYFVLMTCSIAFVIIFGVLYVLSLGYRWMSKISQTPKFTNEPTPKEIGHNGLIKLGVCNAVNGILFSPSTKHTPGSIQSLVMASIIPFTVIASFVFLGRRYQLKHLLSVFVVMGGVVVAVVPSVVSAVSHPEQFHFSLWSLVFLIGVIPGALVNVIQEKYTHSKKFNVFRLLMWQSIYQTITVALNVSWNFVPETGLPIRSWQELWFHFVDGFKCWAHENNTSGCHPGFGLFTLLFVFNYVALYYVTAIIIKKYSSTLVSVTSAPVSPITMVIYYLLNIRKETLNWSVWVSLPIVIVGAISYAICEVNNEQFRQLLSVSVKKKNRISITLEVENGETEQLVSTHMAWCDNGLTHGSVFSS